MKDPEHLGPILRKIYETKLQECETLLAQRNLTAWEKAAQKVEAPRPFLRHISPDTGPALIAEVKKASPSKGVIREDFDPVAIARSYESGGAKAISVLTDAPFFQGSPEIFRAVREAVSLPMLRKDFTISPVQIYEARAMGADAILLITCMLSEVELTAFHRLAVGLGMNALVETHSAADIETALHAMEGDFLLGINNRDLNDSNFDTRLEHGASLLPVVRDLSEKLGRPVPTLVSESGIYTYDDVAFLRNHGFSAILVGESLMREKNTAEAVRSLVAPKR